MDNKPRWILWAGVVVGAILIFAVGGVAGAFVYHELRPERQPELPDVARVVNRPAADVTVLEVVDGSPAAEAGLIPGDRLLQVDGTELGASSSLADLVAAHAPGDELQLTLRHSGSSEDVTLAVTLGENPEQAGAAYLGIRYRQASGAMPGWMPPSARDPRFTPRENLPGMLEQYDQQKAHMFFLEQCSDMRTGMDEAAGVCGLVVAEVAEGSPAQAAGLQVGDLILALNGETLTTRQAFIAAIQAMQPGDEVSLTVYRMSDTTQTEVEVALGKNPDQPEQAFLGVTVPGFFADFGEGTWPPFGEGPGLRQIQPGESPSMNS